jgi:high-affinity nickel-transport protein
MGRGLKSEVVSFYILELIITIILFLWLINLSNKVSSVDVYKNGISFFTLGVLAYTFGLRHALDPDHLAAIDNSTRKLVQDGKSANFTGLFFSLGHSSVVILMSLSLIIATRIIASNIPALENLGSMIGTLVSGFFLYILGLLNFFILLEIYKIFKRIREEKIDDSKLNEILLKRGFMNRYFRNLFKIVKSQYYLYPIGFLFGLGFDTASETALLAISAASAGIFSNIPTWELLIFSFLFTAGMTLVDTTDGFFMNTAYRWAFMGNPLRKIWYNLTMTGISILVAYIIGTLELLGLVQSEFSLQGPFWNFIEIVNQGVWWGNIGLIVIATFALTWITSMVVYKIKFKKYEG